MGIVKYLIPFFYTFSYNRKGLEGVAYLFEFTLLPFVVWLSVPGSGFSLTEVAVTLIAVTTMYELGYIHNNAIAIRNEKDPTIRHGDQELAVLEKGFVKITIFRTTVFLLLIGSLVANQSLYAMELLLIVLMLAVLFYLYNLYKSGWENRVLFFLLRGMRYYAVLLFSGAGAVPAAGVIAVVAFVNHFAWYRERTVFGLGRFFGTKLFDAIVYGLYAVFLLVSCQDESWSRVFFYLFAVKLVLFAVALFQKRTRKLS
jgi:hypothetical protein